MAAKVQRAESAVTEITQMSENLKYMYMYIQAIQGILVILITYMYLMA